MSNIFVRLGILLVFLLDQANAQLNDCEPFAGPQSGLETYCQDEINKRQYKSIVRNHQRNPLINWGKLACQAPQYRSLTAAAQFVDSRNCYEHTRNLFCAVMLPECNGTHVFEACEKMCTDFSTKCNLYSFAGESVRCKGTHFGVLNCKEFQNVYIETNRCKYERVVTSTKLVKNTAPTTTRSPFLSGIDDSKRRPPTFPPPTNRGGGGDSEETTTQGFAKPVTTQEPTCPADGTCLELIEAKELQWRTCLEKFIDPTSKFTVICEWIKSFVRWRWAVFKRWNRLGKRITFEEYDMAQVKCPVQKTVRCYSAKRRKCIRDLHNCPYCYCEIDLDDSYGNILRYWSDDNDFWGYRLQYQWFSMSLNYTEITDEYEKL